MSDKITEITERENKLFNSYNGNIPEATEDWNNLQREKIAAIYENYGRAYIGKINYYGEIRENLTEDTVFIEYTGQMVYNFEADFVVPVLDAKLAEMIVKWNDKIQTHSANLVKSIFKRIDRIGGINFTWS